MLALVGATGQEVGGLLAAMDRASSGGGRGWRWFRGRIGETEALLVQSGMGKERVEDVAGRVLGEHPISGLVSLGFGGALAAQLRVGDVVVCEKLYSDGAETAPCYSDARWVAAAVGAAGKRAPRVSRGSSVTVCSVVTGPSAKRALGEKWGAAVVAMEGYWVARLAAAQGVPFLEVRVISDALTERLLPFDRFLGPHGELLWREATRYFLAHPDGIALVPGVYQNARLASRSLARFIGDVASELDPGGPP